MGQLLVFNPCLQIYKLPDVVDEYIVTCPVPGTGLHRLHISKAAHPETYRVIEELASTGSSLIDLDSDLDDETRSVLEGAGVLIEESSAPSLPLYACQLNEIPPSEIPDGTKLEADRTLRLEPVDFAELHDRMYVRHLLPTQPIAWISNPVTGIESGFWLTPDQAEIVTKLESSRELDISKIPDETLRLFYSAGIVNSASGFRQAEDKWKTKVENAAREFRESGYAVIRELLPPFHLEALRKFYIKYVAEGFMDFGDNQVDDRYCQLNEPFASSLHRGIAELMETIVGEAVKPSYCFAASYVAGSELKPHVDREQCEFSVSFQVDFQPEPQDGRSPWPLSLFRPHGSREAAELYGWEAIEVNGPDLDEKNFYLANGDGLIYRGRELVHYRRPLDSGCTSTSIFLHYVRPDFEGNLF